MSDSLLSVLAPVVRAINEAHYSDYVAFDGGKIHYLAAAAYLNVDTPTTNRLSNFTLSAGAVRTLYRWLLIHDRDESTEIVPGKHAIQFSTKDSVLVLPLSATDEYIDLDEVLLLPKLTHKYELSIPAEQYIKYMARLNVLPKPLLEHAAVTVTIDEFAMFATDTPAGRSSVIFGPADVPEFTPVKWRGKYLLSALSLHAAEATENVKLTFTDNTLNEKSALKVEYEAGVTVVATPLWD